MHGSYEISLNTPVLVMTSDLMSALFWITGAVIVKNYMISTLVLHVTCYLLQRAFGLLSFYFL